MPFAASYLRRFEYVLPMSEEEETFLASLEAGRRVKFRAGEDLFAEGEPVECAYLLQSGWAHFHSELPDGRRQVFRFLIRHDIVGLIGMIFELSSRHRGLRPETVHADYSTSALTPIEATVIGRPVVEELVARHPLLCSALCSYLALEHFDILTEHIMNTGRRSARERMAHLFLELRRRQRAVGLMADREFSLPINQAVLGDALGLSAVHVSRVLSWFTEQQIISVIRQMPQRIVVHDIGRLRKTAGIDCYDDLTVSERRDPAQGESLPGVL